MEQEDLTVADVISLAHRDFAELASCVCEQPIESLLPLIDLLASKLNEPTWLDDSHPDWEESLFFGGKPITGSELLSHGSPQWSRTPLAIPTVAKLVQYYGLSGAEQILDAEDVEDIESRNGFLRRLLESAHFLTTDELATLMEAFLEYIKNNQVALLATGFPTSRFTEWPAPLAVNLYPVRSPFRHLDEDRFKLVWCRPVVSLLESVMADDSGSNGGVHCPPGTVECRHEEAPLTPGMDILDAARIEAGRPVLFDLKIHVLQRLLVALQRNSAVNLWADCLDMFTEALSKDEVDFFLEVDRKWGVPLSRTGSMAGSKVEEMLPGGVTELFELIGYCEKELAIGTMNLIKRSLASIVEHPRRDYYLSILCSPNRSEIDALIDSLEERDISGGRFWTAYQDRVNRALSQEFLEEVVVRTRVKRPHVAMFKPRLELLADWNLEHLEQTGVLPDFTKSQVAATYTNRFQRNNETWSLTFNGTTVHVKDSKGMQYLAYLLKHPHREFPALDLVRVLEGNGRPDGAHDEQATPALLAELGSFQFSGSALGPTIDEEGKKAIQARLRELNDHIEDADLEGNSDLVERYLEEKDQLVQHLSSAYGLNGRPRETGSSAERARTNITKLINRAKNAIGEVHPALREHLGSVKTGKFFTYQPLGSDPPTWEF